MQEFRAAVVNDCQAPFHDPDAVDVATQVIAAFQPHTLGANGDIWDVFGMSKHPNLRTNVNESAIVELETEIDRGFEMLKGIVDEVKPKRVLVTAGNHEFRTRRAIANAPHDVKSLLELKVVREAYSYESLFRLKELGVPCKHAGEYPRGINLHPTLPHERNVWMEHGYISRKRSGFTANALQEERFGNVIQGHCERLALTWRAVNGGRRFFAIENGNLSCLGIPGKGDGIYFGAPLSVPDYRNSTQGFSLLTYTGKAWHAEIIRIENGEAVWGGKTYKSRLK